MGQDKKQLTKLLAFVKELYDNPDNKEFAAGIQAIVAHSALGREIEYRKIDDIYEYCLERNAKDQAKGLYGNFPLLNIKDTLIEDYVIMERFRRRGDFLNFSAHLFLQIENICNCICADEQYKQIYSSILNANIPAFISNKSGFNNRYTDKKNNTVNTWLFGAFDKTEKGIEKKDLMPSSLPMLDKIKCTLYFAGFGDYSGINVPLVAVCNVPPVAQCNVPPQKWLQ